MTTEDNDELILSPAAQAALAEFLAERQAKDSVEHAPPDPQDLSIDAFPEDWQVPPEKPLLLGSGADFEAVAILVRR
jgi:hypothetical protein